MSNIERRSADIQQYPAEPHHGDADRGVEPVVTLLWMTPDPLGALASLTAIYSGRVVRSLDEVTDEDRYQALADMQKTHLTSPLEVIRFHFLIEGVDRAFTHQLVRQRTANYAQESMRFAVLGDLLDATTLPPSLAGTERTEFPEGAWLPSMREIIDNNMFNWEMATEKERNRISWDHSIATANRAYRGLVLNAMPAEEARGLLPHCTATRIHYDTDLRNITSEAGKRLCTQAQFHWRVVFAQMAQQIRDYWEKIPGPNWESERWQYEAIASSSFFRPVCYQMGKCPYDASFDRACSIRERVQFNAKAGASPSEWHLDFVTGAGKAIHPAEWLADPGAARLQSEEQ